RGVHPEGIHPEGETGGEAKTLWAGLVAAGFPRDEVNLRGGTRENSNVASKFSVDKSIFQTKMLLQRQSLRGLVNKAAKMAKIRV
ncbi:MAG: hypothetical protein WBC42_01355, partial [Candidatus Zixiibacteriota bacterium]